MPSTTRPARRHSVKSVARTRNRHILLLLLISLLTYISALPGEMVWSDREDLLRGEYRIQNQQDIVQALSLHGKAYRTRNDGIPDSAREGSWQPLVIISNSIDWLLWADCTFCSHLENLLLHMLVVVGLYALARNLLSQRRRGNAVAFWSAMLFAVHPAGVSSVAWIGGRPVLLASMLAIWSLVMFSRLPATTRTYGHHRSLWLIGFALTSSLAMLSQESAFLLPLAAILVTGLDSNERGRAFFTGASPIRHLGIAISCGVLISILLYRYKVLGNLQMAGSHPTDSMLDNIGTLLRHVWYFIGQTLLPGEPIVSDAWLISDGWAAAEITALLGLILLIAAITLGIIKRHPAAYGGAWFLLWISPGIGLFPSERYHSDQSLYLANWGLIFAIVFVLSKAWRPIDRQLVKGSVILLFTPILLILITISSLSNARWWNHSALFEGEVNNDPYYIEGRIELGKQALADGEAATALNHLVNAIKDNQGEIYTAYFPESPAYRLLGQAQLKLGLYSEAQVSFESAMEKNPASFINAHLLARSKLLQQDYELAAKDLRQAVQRHPENLPVRADLGAALIGLEQWSEGRKYLQPAIEAGLGDFMLHKSLARALIAGNEYAAAATQLDLALQARSRENSRCQNTAARDGKGNDSAVDCAQEPVAGIAE